MLRTFLLLNTLIIRRTSRSSISAVVTVVIEVSVVVAVVIAILVAAESEFVVIVQRVESTTDAAEPPTDATAAETDKWVYGRWAVRWVRVRCGSVPRDATATRATEDARSCVRIYGRRVWIVTGTAHCPPTWCVRGRGGHQQLLSSQ